MSNDVKQYLDESGMDKMLTELRARTDSLYAPKSGTDDEIDRLKKRIAELENSARVGQLAEVEVVE